MYFRLSAFSFIEFFVWQLCFPVLVNHCRPEFWVSICADQNIESLVMHNVLNFIGSVEVRYAMDFSPCLQYWDFVEFALLKCIIFVTSPKTYLLHHELLNFMLVAMSTQLLYGPTPGPTDMNPFIDAAMAQVSGWNLA